MIGVSTAENLVIPPFKGSAAFRARRGIGYPTSFHIEYAGH
jgi:hypothetical protein